MIRDSSVEPAAGNPFSAHEAMLSWVRDIAPYGLFTTDENLVVRDWNQWLVTHSGLTPAAVIGRPLLELFPELAARRMREHFMRALRGEIVVLSAALHKYLLPLPSPVRDYTEGHMLQTVRIAPLPAGGRIVGTIVILEDVTQRESQAAILRRQQEYDRLRSEALAQLLRSENPWRTAADIFPQIAAALKLDVHVSYQLAAGGTRLCLQHASGIPPESRRTIAALDLDDSVCGQAVVNREPVTVAHIQETDTACVGPARRLGLRSCAAFPLLIGDRVLGTLAFGSYGRDAILPEEIEFLATLTQYVAIALDRADREADLHAAQARLSAHAEDLEARIAERTARLQESIVQLESFSYTIAHDLRAPIRSLTTFSDILIDEYGTVVPTEAQDILRRLQRASHRLDALTLDLLAFSRIARADVQLAPISLDETIANLVADMPALQGRLVMPRALGVVLAQRTLLQQCLSNLFDNAVKFARPGVPLTITVRTEHRATPTVQAPTPGLAPLIPSTLPAAPVVDGPRLRVWIEDNGIGIPPEAHEKIWGVFERLPNAMGTNGTGIGLAIVARAIQQMGGVCGVESEAGHGARFWFELAAAA